LHLTRDVPNPAQLIPDIPRELQRFITGCTRCDPDARYRDVNQALAVLQPLVQDIRLPTEDPGIEDPKTTALYLRFTDQNQQDLARLVDAFKSKTAEFGVKVDFPDEHTFIYLIKAC